MIRSSFVLERRRSRSRLLYHSVYEYFCAITLITAATTLSIERPNASINISTERVVSEMKLFAYLEKNLVNIFTVSRIFFYLLLRSSASNSRMIFETNNLSITIIFYYRIFVGYDYFSISD